MPCQDLYVFYDSLAPWHDRLCSFGSTIKKKTEENEIQIDRKKLQYVRQHKAFNVHAFPTFCCWWNFEWKEQAWNVNKKSGKSKHQQDSTLFESVTQTHGLILFSLSVLFFLLRIKSIANRKQTEWYDMCASVMMLANKHCYMERATAFIAF